MSIVERESLARAIVDREQLQQSVVGREMLAMREAIAAERSRRGLTGTGEVASEPRQIRERSPAPQSNRDQIEDETAYRPASEVIASGDRVAGLPQLNRLLKSINSEDVVIRTQKPARNRLLIHVGDWHAYWAEHDRLQDAAMSDEALSEKLADIAARHERERRKKSRK